MLRAEPAINAAFPYGLYDQEEVDRLNWLLDIARRGDVEALREADNEPGQFALVFHVGGQLIRLGSIRPRFLRLMSSQMAKEGNDAAVTMLLEELQDKGSVIDGAIEVYLRLQHYDKVDALLPVCEAYSLIGMVVAWYATLGLSDKVEPLLQRYQEDDAELLDTAMSSYAFGGYAEPAEVLLASGGDRQVLLFHYALGGHLHHVNRNIESASINQRRRNRQAALEGLFEGDMLDVKEVSTLVKVLAHFDQNATRSWMLEHVMNTTGLHFHRATVLDHAKRYNNNMQKYRVDYDSACAIEVPGVRIWMLQGRQRQSHAGRVPYNIFIKTLMHVTDLSYEKTEALYLAVCRHTYDAARQSVLTEGTLFANRHGKRARPARHTQQLAELDARYDERQRRIGL